MAKRWRLAALLGLAGLAVVAAAKSDSLSVAGAGGSGGSVTQGTSPWVDNITQWASGTIGAMANYGTSPGAVLVPGVNANVTNANANGAAAASASSPVTDANNPVGSAVFAATQVSVANTATSILSARTGVSGTGRVCATITNTSTVAVYLGGSGVTTSTGDYLAGVAGASKTICTTAAIYGIVATGTETVSAVETY